MKVPHPNWHEIHQFFCDAFPDMSSFFVGITIYHDDQADTAYAMANGSVVLNQTYSTMNDANFPDIIRQVFHEVLHVHLLHHMRGHIQGVFSSPEKKQIWNIAADISVNCTTISILRYFHANVPPHVLSVYEKTVDAVRELTKEKLKNLIDAVENAAKPNVPVDFSKYVESQITERIYQTILDTCTNPSDLVYLNVPDMYEHLAAPNDYVTQKSYNMLDNHDYGYFDARSVVTAYLQRKRAWELLYSKFKLRFGGKEWKSGLLSQRTLLRRQLGGLPLMSRKHRYDSHTAGSTGKHSDALLLMDVSGSIERAWVHKLTKGIMEQLESNGLKGANLFTYNTSLSQHFYLANAQSLNVGLVNVGGGTNINNALRTLLDSHQDKIKKAKICVIFTDGEDDPISLEHYDKLNLPILIVYIASIDSLNDDFYNGAANLGIEQLVLPVLIA